MLPAAQVGAWPFGQSALSRRLNCSQTSAEPTAIAPSRRAREPNKAPRDTVLTRQCQRIRSPLAFRQSRPWRECAYCSTGVRACRPACMLVRERPAAPEPDCVNSAAGCDYGNGDARRQRPRHASLQVVCDCVTLEATLDR